MSFRPKRKSEESAAEGGRPGKRERLTTDYKFRTRQEEDEDSSGAVDFVRTKVKYQDSTVGRLSGSLFQRDGEFTDGFYDACDEVSEETQECSVLFFKDTGKLQGVFAHKVSRTCNTGGYLHIESIEVDEDFRGQGLGLRLLQRCLDDIEGWTIAMIQPSPFSTNGEQKDADIFAGIGSLGRHFARLGFRQCDSNPASERAKFWYLEKCNYHGEILDKESVQDLKVVLPVLAPAVSGLSDEIREIICPRSPPVYIGPGTGAVSTMAAHNRSQLGNVLSRGGNLDESGALHFAVANQKHDFLRLLVELGANINHADHAGNTPLHVAASAFNASGVTALLQLGADKRVKNSAGQTAAQLVRDERKILCKISVFQGGSKDADATIAALR